MTVLQPSFEEFTSLASSGNLIPVWTELAADYETPVSVFQKLSENQRTPSFLLESAENSEQIGRYSFLGTNPRLEIRCHGRTLSLREQGQSEFVTRELPPSEGDPLHELERIMARFQPVAVEGLPVFAGGAVGFIGYDMVRFFEPSVPGPPDDGLGLPDMAFVITDTLLIFDHRFRKLQVVANISLDDHPDPASGYEAARAKIDALIEILRTPRTVAPFSLMENPAEAEIRSNTTREEYEHMVARAKEYILAGDIFQVVPSQRFENDYSGRPIDLYRALRHVNPSPYMFCLQFGDEFALVGSSPEVHVQAIDRNIKIRPIAGTRWRGKTQEEDDALAAELLADPKERAEHVMLIDLARNDVGRVAEYHSVELSEFMIVERYSHVMHIVSNVVGRLREGLGAYDVMRATFPAGTVSGSPKVRAMQIINEMEKSKRGAYAGAVGYFGFDGNHDSCIALRTVVLKDGKAYVQAGAGVVADSVPANEYDETVNKAKGMMRAIERAKLLK
ncbi:MAG: anthranilate synthase component I [Verrucomicrobiaceae bacterium]|nr:anthranilate synthase component I [Verrucomicrobiaceae bacterium]